ncbi:CobW family GTP-binding protein [Phytohabitans kaempferiae]|uniref:CobW family GTP-binding protein n=1 Tax=Phytohabitans kaempferiae TaxID=1620943 RepID=A0ABV6M8P8_9ACTN
MSSSPVAPAPDASVDAAARPSLTVLYGFWSGATQAVARALVAADPSVTLIRHGPNATADRLRDDVLPSLARLAGSRPARDVVLVLPEEADPETVCAASTHCLVGGVPLSDLVRVRSHVTVVDAEHLLDGLGTDDDLVALGIQAGDHDCRAVADVVVRQIECADALVLWQSRADPLATAQAQALLHRLAPWVPCLPVARDRIDAAGLVRHLRHSGHRPQVPGVLARGLEGYPLGVHEPQPRCDIVSAVFRARRPFHPQRLYDTLETLQDGVLRSRGHLWLASQPDTVVAWDFTASGLTLGTLGRWLAAVPDDCWDLASDDRRLAAAFDWDPYYEDRHQHLVFIGLDLDAADLQRTLSGCLLTDTELADGATAWRDYPDPFAGRFPAPDLRTDGNAAT